MIGPDFNYPGILLKMHFHIAELKLPLISRQDVVPALKPLFQYHFIPQTRFSGLESTEVRALLFNLQGLFGSFFIWVTTRSHSRSGGGKFSLIASKKYQWAACESFSESFGDTTESGMHNTIPHPPTSKTLWEKLHFDEVEATRRAAARYELIN